ncbi:MAG: hypothetical protein M3478_13150 [Planctomycetota bacterium]|nr:hypothetical protein [Planctomycetota bacterium]
MLLQTNSYIVPKEKRAEHTRLVRRFRQTLGRLGCEHFEVYEQVGSNWGSGETTGRFVHIMRFRDRKHQLAVQSAERNDPAAQALIAEFCELINFPYQQQQGLFAVGFYHSVLPVASPRASAAPAGEATVGEAFIEDAPAEDPVPADAHDVSDDDVSIDALSAERAAEDVVDLDDLGDDDASSGEPSTRRNA